VVLVAPQNVSYNLSIVAQQSRKPWVYVFLLVVMVSKRLSSKKTAMTATYSQQLMDVTMLAKSIFFGNVKAQLEQLLNADYNVEMEL
jgi:hypothetical protein